MSYYNLEQTLEVFQKNLPETLLPFGSPQLADLCRRGEVTPVFPYARYVSEGFLDENDQIVSTKKNTKSFNGYLTLPDLTDLLFQLTETVVTSNAYIYEEIGTKDKGKLVTLEKGIYDRNEYYNYREHDYYDSVSSGNAHYIAINNLLFPSEQVQVYISSKRTDEPNKPTATGTFGNPTVAYDEPETIEQFREALAAANAKIVDLDSQLTQARVDFEQAIINNKALYTTPAINIMNAVITEFWINYHPDQPAPKQSTITKWIIDNFDGISDALALNIDKVCRHSDARSGGKYKR
ncbi:MAG: hypothetical protein WA114_01015 [Psychrobacter glacincola]